MEVKEVKGLTYRVHQKGDSFYPQFKYGFTTMWSWENISDTYERFIKLNKIENQELNLDNRQKTWTIYFYDLETAENYIENILKEKHFRKYYNNITKFK